jgi:uncharacterized membrane protein YfcA
MGAINLNEIIYFVGFSVIGSFVGNLIIYRLIQKYKKPSILVWVLFILFFLSLLILPSLGIVNVINQGRLLEFNTPC